MIVNSDERQWTWMDEGLTTFVQYVAEQDFGEWYPDAIAPNKTVSIPKRSGQEYCRLYVGRSGSFSTYYDQRTEYL